MIESMDESEALVISRPKATHWAYVGMPVVYAAGLAVLPFLDDRGRPMPVGGAIACWVLAGCLAATAPPIALWVVRTRISLKTEGIVWQRLTSHIFVAWSEVTDYYVRATEDRAKLCTFLIEAGARRLGFSAEWTNVEELKAAVVARATNARAREWGVRGIRIVDEWPQTFSYDRRALKRMRALSATFIIGLLGFGVFAATVYLLGTMQTLGTDIAVALAIGLASVGIVLAVLPISLFLAAGRTMRRCSETITVDLEGIRFTGPGRNISAAWRDVEDYYLVAGSLFIGQPDRYYVQTTEGMFDFLLYVRPWHRLHRIIKDMATHAESREWDYRRKYELYARATGIFHYRTCLNRALIWILAAFSGACIWSGSIAEIGLASGVDSVNPIFIVAGIMGFATLWARHRYRRAWIRVDEGGISRQGVLGVQRISWRDVQSLTLLGSDIMSIATVQADGRRIRFPCTIAAWPTLKAIIAEKTGLTWS